MSIEDLYKDEPDPAETATDSSGMNQNPNPMSINGNAGSHPSDS